MSKVLVILGATGQQGGSVLEYVLKDPELSQRYKVRAITRDVNSEKSIQLKQKHVEVVQADVSDRQSLKKAFSGANTVFAMTTNTYSPEGFDIEYNKAKNMADVAVEEGVEYFIFSTLPSLREISGGKYAKVCPFDAKAAAEQYIKTLPIKSAFYCAGSFMENFHPPISLGLRKDDNGAWNMAMHVSPKTQFPLIDAVGDSGKVVGAILADPNKYERKTFHAAVRLYNLEEIVAIMSKAANKEVKYKQISVEQFKESIAIMGESAVDIFVEAFSHFEQFGYFGPNAEEKIAWAAENARGTLSTYEQYLEAHPLMLS